MTGISARSIKRIGLARCSGSLKPSDHDLGTGVRKRSLLPVAPAILPVGRWRRRDSQEGERGNGDAAGFGPQVRGEDLQPADRARACARGRSLCESEGVGVLLAGAPGRSFANRRRARPACITV